MLKNRDLLIRSLENARHGLEISICASLYTGHASPAARSVTTKALKRWARSGEVELAPLKNPDDPVRWRIPPPKPEE